MSSTEFKPSAWDWARWIVGTVIFCGMLYAHLIVKDIPLILFGVPAFLIGIKPDAIVDRLGGKK